MSHNNRDKTRRQRYNDKMDTCIRLPLSIATINFDFDENLAFAIRSAACYGALNIFVIGRIPPTGALRAKSGTLVDFVNLKSFANPSEFLQYCRDDGIDIISAELSDDSHSLFDFNFNFTKRSVIVLGHETTGVPAEILAHSTKIHIPMFGPGFCLNTSQTGTAMMSEYARQYAKNILGNT